MKEVKYWVISDTHFNHSQMFTYCDRPKDYEYKLIKSLQRISEEDILIHLGDICIGEDLKTHEFIKSLKCKKILVKGNHDKKSNSWYLRNGWDFVCDYFEDVIHGKRVRFSHAPFMDYDGINIHGHLHNTCHHEKYNEKARGDLILIAVENTNYQPVLLRNILNQLTN